MGEWHDFFLAQAGAAGVLTGLVFVGVSINLEKIMSQPGYGLPGRAAEALILLVAVLTASLLLLVPQGKMMVEVEVLAIGIAAWGWVVVIQLLRLSSWQAMEPELRRAFVLRAALGQVATLPFIAAGIAVLAAGVGASIGWWRARSSRSSWRCSMRGCCSSRSTDRRGRGLVAALLTQPYGRCVLRS